MKVMNTYRLITTAAVLLAVQTGTFLYAARTVIRTESAVYTVVSDKTADAAAVERFDSALQPLAEEVFSRIGVKTPLSFSVTLCFGAWLFKKETGLDEHTPGIYIPVKRLFVFQNPKALENRGILQQVLRHELCHAAIDEWRTRKGIDYSEQNRWLEESICAALYPSGDFSAEGGVEKFKEMRGDEKIIKKYIESNIKSSSYDARRKAYSLAAAFGRNELEKKGLPALLNKLLPGGKIR